jgi:hypothetical protein
LLTAESLESRSVPGFGMLDKSVLPKEKNKMWTGMWVQCG